MKLKPILALLFLAASFAYISGCKKDGPHQATMTQRTQQFADYPFGIGREWHYNTTVTVYLSDTTVDHYVKVYKHLSDTTINGIPCHKVGTCNSSGVSHNYTEYDYYANMPDGLHIIAREGNAGGFTWFRSNSFSKIKTRLYESGLSIAKVDSVFIPDTALHLTRLPIVYGQEWYSYEYGSQFHNKRKWLAPSIADVPVGTFDCVKLQFITGVGNPANFHVYQHFGSKGLIKVEMQQDSVTTGNGVFGQLISTSELSYVNF